MKRPFRLEKTGASYAIGTFATLESAMAATPRLPLGSSWRIVERYRTKNAQGRDCTRTRTVADSQSGVIT